MSFETPLSGRCCDSVLTMLADSLISSVFISRSMLPDFISELITFPDRTASFLSVPVSLLSADLIGRFLADVDHEFESFGFMGSVFLDGFILITSMLRVLECLFLIVYAPSVLSAYSQEALVKFKPIGGRF